MSFPAPVVAVTATSDVPSKPRDGRQKDKLTICAPQSGQSAWLCWPVSNAQVGLKVIAFAAIALLSMPTNAQTGLCKTLNSGTTRAECANPGAGCDVGNGPNSGFCSMAGGECDCLSNGKSYTLSASPLAPNSVAPGASATSTITLSPTPTYTLGVTLSCLVTGGSTPAPACTFSPAGVNRNSSTSQLTVSTSGQTPTGTYTVAVVGKDSKGDGPSNGISPSLTLGVQAITGTCVYDPNAKQCVVQSAQYCSSGSGGAGSCSLFGDSCSCFLPTYTVTIGPFNPSPVKQGEQATAQVTVVPSAGAQGYLGNVNLVVSSCPLLSASPQYAGGLTCNINPPTVTSIGAPASSTLQVTTDLKANPLNTGPYQIVVTSNEGGDPGASQSANLNVTPKAGGGGVALIIFLALLALWSAGGIRRRKRCFFQWAA
jgi:hypothetical protein